MKSILFAFFFACCCFTAYSQTLTQSTNYICSGNTVALTGSGETLTGGYFSSGNDELLDSTNSTVKARQIVIHVDSESWYSPPKATRYVLRLTLVGVTGKQKVTINMSMFKSKVVNGTPVTQGIVTVPFTITVDGSCPPQVVNFIVKSTNSKQTSFVMSDNNTNIASGYFIAAGGVDTIKTSFNPYTAQNPYKQITPSANSTVVITVIGGYLPVQASVNTGSGANWGTVKAGPGPNQETITFNGVNITTVPENVVVTLQ